MVARRTILKNSQEKLPKVIEEAGMRHYIAVSLSLSGPAAPFFDESGANIHPLESEVHNATAHSIGIYNLPTDRPPSGIFTSAYEPNHAENPAYRKNTHLEFETYSCGRPHPKFCL